MDQKEREKKETNTLLLTNFPVLPPMTNNVIGRKFAVVSKLFCSFGLNTLPDSKTRTDSD